jgi:Domain of unknown function (DUF5658)
VVTTRLVIAMFLIAQACDGVLTYIAIQRFGIVAEANPLLVTWVTLVGAQPAIVGAKLMASACGVLLYYFGMAHVLFALTLFYAGAAIGPWLAVFHQF